ncbi:MAG: glycosyltransferase [Alphaproteobacteria bacterium]|nr:glycosyltransferase [Alphaproteobacteria bacterium]
MSKPAPNVTLHVVQHLRPGGIEVLALEILRNSPRGEEVHVASLEGNARTAAAAWPRLQPHLPRLHFLGKRPGVRPGVVRDLRALIARIGATAVHTHHIGPLIYGGCAARLAGVEALAHTEHDVWHLRRPKDRTLSGLAFDLFRPLLLTPARQMADTLHRIWPRLDVRVVHSGIDTTRFTPGDKVASRQAVGLPRTAILIGTAGRLEQEKNHRLLLSALAKLPSTVHLAVAGSGSQAEALAAETKRLGLANRVHWLGHVEDMPRFYRALDVFCLPSSAEGLPVAALEAQACGIPAVVTDVGGTMEALCPVTGRLVPPGNVEAFAAALHDQALRVRPSSPRPHVVERWDIRKMASAYASIAHDMPNAA